MSVKIELEWFTTEEKAHPDKPTDSKSEFPTEACFVNLEGFGIVVRHWDYYHECWNDEENDDYECGPEGVKGWAIIPDAIP